MCRSLEKKVLVEQNFNDSGYQRKLQLEYYLLEGFISDCEELTGIKTYGIEIVMKTYDENTEDENINIEEREIIRDLSSSKETTKIILDKLASNTVTPIELPFIIDDIVGVIV